jgi:hypothetical protein
MVCLATELLAEIACRIGVWLMSCWQINQCFHWGIWGAFCSIACSSRQHTQNSPRKCLTQPGLCCMSIKRFCKQSCVRTLLQQKALKTIGPARTTNSRTWRTLAHTCLMATQWSMWITNRAQQFHLAPMRLAAGGSPQPGDQWLCLGHTSTHIQRHPLRKSPVFFCTVGDCFPRSDGISSGGPAEGLRRACGWPGLQICGPEGFSKQALAFRTIFWQIVFCPIRRRFHRRACGGPTEGLRRAWTWNLWPEGFSKEVFAIRPMRLLSQESEMKLQPCSIGSCTSN